MGRQQLVEPLDCRQLPDVDLRWLLKIMNNRFLTAFGHIDLLAMSNESAPADFRYYIELSRESRRRKRKP